MIALPIRIRPRSGEPIHSTALRLAARHGSRSAAAFLAPFGLSPEGLLAGRGIREFAAMLGAAPADFDDCAPEIDVRERTVRIRGETLLLNDWSTTARRWCPDCFRDDRQAARTHDEPEAAACWHRIAWDLRSISSCANHGTLLCAQCQACGSSQDWDWPFLDRCRCRGDLAGSETRKIADGEGLWDSYVHGRLGEGPRLSSPLLDADVLKRVLPSVERLGWAMLLDYRSTRTKASQEARPIARDAGMAALVDWPNAFVACLDRVSRERGTNNRKPGLIGAYGWIHSEWAYLPPVSELDRAVRLQLREHAVANAIVPQNEPVYGLKAGEFVSMTRAAEHLGMGYSAARDVLESRGAIPEGVRRGVAFPIRSEDVNAAAAFRDRSSPAAVRMRLGIGKSQARAVARLACHGHLANQRNGLDKLLANCRRGATLFGNPSTHLSPLPYACRNAGVSIERACEALMKGKLQAKALVPGDETLKGILIDPVELRQFRSRSWLSIEATAARLGIHHEAVRWLVHEGHLSRPALANIGVDAASVAEFAEKYVPASVLAREGQTSSKALARALLVAGVFPAFGPPACRQMIYIRDEVRCVERPASNRCH